MTENIETDQNSLSLGMVNSLGLLGGFIIMAICLRIISGYTLPQYESIFEKLEVDLPALTQSLITGSFYWPLYIFMLIAIMKEPFIKNKVLSSTIN